MMRDSCSKPVIRPATAEDVPACARIESLCFPEAEAASLEKIEKRQRLFPEGFLVAEVGGELVGFVNSGATNETDLSDEALKDMVGHDPAGANLVIFSLAVTPARQGQGVARRLLETFAATAGSLGRKAILLLCKERLVRYYARFGFDDLGESASAHGGARWHQMRLDLNARAEALASRSRAAPDRR